MMRTMALDGRGGPPLRSGGGGPAKLVEGATTHTDASRRPLHRLRRSPSPVFDRGGSHLFRRVFSFISAIAAHRPAWGLDPRAAKGEGSARLDGRAQQGPLTLTLSPSTVPQPDFVAIHIPVRGSFIHVAPR